MEHAVRHLKSADPVLAELIEQVGPCKLAYREPSFDTIARSIVFQQLSGKAARTIYDRLVAACGGRISPERIRKLRAPRLRKAGLSRQKISYLRDLAKRTAAGEIEFERLHAMPDDEVIEHLTRVKGIGVWSAHMFLIFALRREDVLPVGDLGVRAAIRKLYRKRSLPTPRQIEKIAAPWRPYCSIATWYLWRSFDAPRAAAVAAQPAPGADILITAD